MKTKLLALVALLSLTQAYAGISQPVNSELPANTAREVVSELQNGAHCTETMGDFGGVKNEFKSAASADASQNPTGLSIQGKDIQGS